MCFTNCTTPTPETLQTLPCLHRRPCCRWLSGSTSAATLELPPRRPSDARADEVNPGQVRQRLQVFKVSRDIRVVEANLGQVQQRLEVFDVSRDARVVEANHGQLHQRLQVFNVSRDARVVEENHGQL